MTLTVVNGILWIATDAYTARIKPDLFTSFVRIQAHHNEDECPFEPGSVLHPLELPEIDLGIYLTHGLVCIHGEGHTIYIHDKRGWSYV